MLIGNDIKEGDIRLVDGSYLWQGLVEIFLDGIWGTINRVGAYSNEARVVCRQLGYNTYSKILHMVACYWEHPLPWSSVYSICRDITYM